MKKKTTSQFSTVNVLGIVVICIFAAIYLIPGIEEQFIEQFYRRYADAILLGFIFFTISNKLIISKARFDPLFWYLIGGAFFSWFVLTLVRISVWQKLNTTDQNFASDISYFLFYALMITAIEVKSFSRASKFLTQRSLITSLSIITFLLGSFTYLILLPSKLDSSISTDIHQSFYFYILMDAYLVLRWWHLAWQARRQSYIGYFLLGLASFNWLVADLMEYFVLTENSSLSVRWLEWLWYFPYVFLFFGIKEVLVETDVEAKKIQFNSYHLFNSPLFFLGIISVWFLIENNMHPIANESSLQKVQAVWLIITLSLAIFQSMELFESNKRRKLALSEALLTNRTQAQELKQVRLLMESQSNANQIILDTISNPIFTLDLSGKVLSNNLATSKLLGYSESELIGNGFSTLIPEEEEFHHFFDYQSYRQQLTKNQQGLELESSILTKSGEQISVHVTISQNNRMTRDTLVVSLADIRQQKKAEKQLHNLKDEFTANISHEFRTPLTIVNGVIEDLLNKSSESDSLEQLQTAKRNNLRLIHMVDQLLELSRVASDTMPIADIDASDWVEPICKSYKTIAKDRDIDYLFSISEKIYIRGNQQAFENILYNLISNAFKYTPKGGSINILLEEQETGYQLIVADTGVGISKEEQSKIFDRFQRSEIDNQHAIPGAGIGLSLVKDLVSSMDWNISLESTPNKGSKFIVDIKRALNEILPQESVANESRVEQVSFLEAEITRPKSDNVFSKSKYLVLIIEDNLDMQRHLENILNPHHQCLIASNGKQGLSMAEEFLPDIIISDVMMPGIDGFEVLKTIKEQAFTTHIPVIMLTARSDQKSKIEGLTAEADDYLTKPFNAEELLIKINNQLKVRKKLQQKYESQWKGFTQVDSPEESETIENSFLLELNHVFEEFYKDANFSMNFLASELAMSERQLQRKIKALVDVSPLELLKRYRLEKSKNELKQNTQIGLVAQSCGFSSQTYFGRCFKEHFGITPKVYQQQQK